METNHLLITLMLSAVLLLAGCGAKETPVLAVSGGAWAGELTGLNDCEFQTSGGKTKFASECGTLATVAVVAFVWFLNYWDLLGRWY